MKWMCSWSWRRMNRAKNSMDWIKRSIKIRIKIWCKSKWRLLRRAGLTSSPKIRLSLPILAFFLPLLRQCSCLSFSHVGNLRRRMSLKDRRRVINIWKYNEIRKGIVTWNRWSCLNWMRDASIWNFCLNNDCNLNSLWIQMVLTIKNAVD